MQGRNPAGLNKNAVLTVFLSFLLGGCLSDVEKDEVQTSAFVGPALNHAPQISGTPQSGVLANNSYQFEPVAVDADNDQLAFSVSRLPAWAQFSGATGRLDGTPTDADVGVYTNVQISVSDGRTTADLAPFSITVSAAGAANSPPIISGTPQTTVNTEKAYIFTPTATDVDNDVLLFSISQQPSWATFDQLTGELTGTPTTSDTGTYSNISISVSDGEFQVFLPEFSITVSTPVRPNSPPEISGTPSTSIDANDPYSFTPTASDADGDTLRFSVSGLPVWANFSDITGQVSGTPGDADIGVYSNIQISVSDAVAITNLDPFSITVNAVTVTNTPPVISGTPSTSIDANSMYSFAPIASDADGDPLTFSVSGLPLWANFSGATGRISGTPLDADVGIYPDIQVSVADGTATADLAPFSITVTAVSPTNAPPVISGSPPTSINANNPYSFTPVASDPDGDTLMFSISGLPVWASFSDVTGEISGTPGDADVGLYSDIRVSVSDGIATDNLAPFSITVNKISLGSVTLSWMPPTENEDGSPLFDLAKYRIYWGTEPGDYTNSVTFDAGITTYVIEGLALGTYEFVATSINTDGVESAHSNSVVKTIFE